MTRKDYIIIANVLKENFEYLDQDDIEYFLRESIKKNLIENFCLVLKADNNNFNPTMFKRFIEKGDK